MIDIFALLLSHALLALAGWRLMMRDDLDPVPQVRARHRRARNDRSQGGEADA